MYGHTGQKVESALREFSIYNCEDIGTTLLLQLTARIQELRNSFDENGVFGVLRRVMRGRVLMATDEDLFVQKIIPLIFTTCSVLKICEKSPNEIRFLLDDDGGEYVFQRNRMLIKKKGARAVLYDVNARSDELRALFFVDACCPAKKTAL
jgi:hypothetical protein